ncbi:hypothetical protein Tco_1266106 [Tanacetum coccineum]
MALDYEVTLDAADNFVLIFNHKPLQKVQYDEDSYNVFANDRQHHEKPESVNDTYPDEQDDTNITTDSLVCVLLERERDLLASLIDKLKCEIDDSKNRNKLLESSNKTLVDKLKGEIEDFKTKNKSLESSNNHFKEANNELSKTNQLVFKDLKKFQAKLDRYHDVNYVSKVEIDCAKAKVSQEKEAQNKFYITREDKEIEKVTTLENKVKVLDDIVYKTGQSIQTMNMLNRNCKTSFAKPEFLRKAQRANPRMYDIGCYNDNLALMLALESDEIILLAHESGSKLSDLIKPFDYKNLNNLYDLFVPQREKSPEQRYFSERTKQPIAVPISTREPNRTVNQSVATPLKRTVALESTNQKPRNKRRKQYDQISKTSRRDNSIHHRLCVLKAHDKKSQASKFELKRGDKVEFLMVKDIAMFCLLFRVKTLLLPLVTWNVISHFNVLWFLLLL